MFGKGNNKRVHEYLLAPNFDLCPPPDGPLMLGHILDDPSEPRYPLNTDAVVTPLDSQSYTQTATGVSAVRSQLDRSEFKLWARLADLMPVGADADVTRDKSSTDLFHIETVETTYFLPSNKYLEASVKVEDVTRYLEGGLWGNDVYMVTGLKVARNGTVTSYASDGKKTSAGGSVDFKQLGAPLTAGVSGGTLAATDEVTHIASLGPFVLAYQVRKIVYRKGKRTSTVAHNRGAVFGNDPDDASGPYDGLVVDGLEDQDTVPESVRSGGSWVSMALGNGEAETEERLWLRKD